MKILISDKMSNKVEDVLKSKQINYDIKTGLYIIINLFRFKNVFNFITHFIRN